MSTFLWNAKGYIIHYLAVAILFLDPSVQAYFSGHPLYAMVGLALEGSILHWATGKLSSPKSAGSLALVAALLLVPVFVAGCSAQKTAQQFSNVFSGILNIAQAEEPALSPSDAAIVTPWVSLGFTLNIQLNTCIAASGNTKAKLASCITSFASGLLSPTEQAQLRILSPSVQKKVQIVATAVIIAVNSALTQFGGSAQPTPAISSTPASAAELHYLSVELRNEGYPVE